MGSRRQTNAHRGVVNSQDIKMPGNGEKPKFDKKKWRTEKYSNKVRVDKFQEKRKKYLEPKYFRMLQREGKLNNANLVPVGGSPGNNTGENSMSKEDKSTKNEKKNFRKTKEDFERRKKQAENKQKAEDRKKRFQEQKEAKQIYKSKKAERFKILSKKTSRGQPLMSGRIEMLLEKIKADQ